MTKQERIEQKADALLARADRPLSRKQLKARARRRAQAYAWKGNHRPKDAQVSDASQKNLEDPEIALRAIARGLTPPRQTR